MITPAVSLVIPRRAGAVVPSHDDESRLHNGAELSDDVFVAAIDAERPTAGGVGAARRVAAVEPGAN